MYGEVGRMSVVTEVERARLSGDDVPIGEGGETSGPFSLNALTVLEHRYLRREDTGKVVESPEEMFWRVARVGC